MRSPDVEIVARLEAAPDPVPAGNWLDVRRRKRELDRRRRARIATALAAALAVIVLSVPALGLESRLWQLLSLEESPEPVPSAPAEQGETKAPPVAYIHRSTLVGFPGSPHRLAADLSAPLLRPEARLAVASPDGRYVVYHMSDGWRPSLRLYDVVERRDVLLARGAHSPAWRDDGAIAYVQGVKPRSPSNSDWRYPAHVVVRATPFAPPVRWTRDARTYRVLGWARSTLLVETALLDPPRAIFALDPPGPAGPSRPRPFPLGLFTAISPDGRLAFGSGPLLGSPSPDVRVVEVATGRVLVDERLADLAAAGPRRTIHLAFGVDANGAWLGDGILAVAPSATNQTSSLVLLRFRGGMLSVERVLRLDRAAKLPRGNQGLGYYQPSFLDANGRFAVVRAIIDPSEGSGARPFATFLTCDLVDQRCVRGRKLPEEQTAAVVYRMHPKGA